MGDADQPEPEERIWHLGSLVREIPLHVEFAESRPQYEHLKREQFVSAAYKLAARTVLLEQSELYVDMLTSLGAQGGSSAALRAMALDRARIIAELFLALLHEDVAVRRYIPDAKVLDHALSTLDLIESCDVLLTAERPREELLMAPAELDAWLHGPVLQDWWSDDGRPQQYGAEHDRASWVRAMEAGVAVERPADRAAARQAAVALGECLEASATSYRSLLAAHARSGDDPALREQALQRALEITTLVHGTWRRMTFEALGRRLNPDGAVLCLQIIARSCIVLAAPGGDFDRYAVSGELVDRALSDRKLGRWRRAVAAL